MEMKRKRQARYLENLNKNKERRGTMLKKKRLATRAQKANMTEDQYTVSKAKKSMARQEQRKKKKIRELLPQQPPLVIGVGTNVRCLMDMFHSVARTERVANEINVLIKTM